MTKRCEARLLRLAQRIDIERIGISVDYDPPARIKWVDSFTSESGDLCTLGSGVRTITSVLAYLQELRKEYASLDWQRELNDRLNRRACAWRDPHRRRPAA